jgi:hypothetical protein
MPSNLSMGTQRSGQHGYGRVLSFAHRDSYGWDDCYADLSVRMQGNKSRETLAQLPVGVSANSTIESRVVVRKNRPPASFSTMVVGWQPSMYKQPNRFGSRLRLITTPLVVCCRRCVVRLVLQSEYRCAMRRMGDSLRKEMMLVVAQEALVRPKSAERLPTEACIVHAVTRLLRVYNCDYIRPPRPERFARAMKQIYRPAFVLSHFVHYSTITANIARYKDARSEVVRFELPGLGVMHFWMSLHREYWCTKSVCRTKP